MRIPPLSPQILGRLVRLTNIPLLGKVIIFLLIFLPPVFLSFLLSWLLIMLRIELGFTEILLLFLPVWNFILAKAGLQLSFIGLPAWQFWGIISLIKMVGHMLFDWPL